MVRLHDLAPHEAVNALRNGDLSVGVFGFGHVGLPLGIAWGRAGAKVIGVTKDSEHIKLIERGESPFPEEEGLAEGIKECLGLGRLKVTDDSSLAANQTDLKIIIVPIPFEPPKRPDFSALKDVAMHIGKALKRGDIVDLESSVPPGTTNVVLKPLLERHSGLKAGEDFGLVYSPERIFVGRALADIGDRYPKVIGSDSDKALRIMSELYSQISKKGVLPMSGATAAELEKLFEGVYRDVNIGLANELADLASRLGISYYEVRDAANSQPYSHLHVPGVGVGGFCIPVYSNYIIDQGKRNSVPTPITATARRSNEDRPKKLSVELLNLMKRSRIKSRAAKVAVLGISFRGNTGDTRLSPSIDLIQHLAPHVAEVRVYDPIATTVRFSRKNISRVDTLEKALFGASAVCVTVEHEEFTKLTFEQLAKPLKRPALIVDYKRVVKGDIPADRTIVSRVTGEPSPGGS